MSEEPPPISEKIRALLEADTRPLKRIARLADVNYRRLHNWHSGLSSTLDADMAEAIYKVLTGRRFTRGN